MANLEQYNILRQGASVWNKWRAANPSSQIDMIEADLRGVDLSGANLVSGYFTGAKLCNANLSRSFLMETYLMGADLSYSNLTKTDMNRASLNFATLKGANLDRTSLIRADLSDADFTDANLLNTDFTSATLVGTVLRESRIDNLRIYGVSAWDMVVENCSNSTFIITPFNEPVIIVDNAKVAQFIYLMLRSAEIREIIQTVGRKAVLILGRFTEERLRILHCIRDELRKYGYVSIIFDFQNPEGRSFIETMSTLAHISRFIIADITDAKVVLQELERIVPSLPSVPIVPLIQKGENIHPAIGNYALNPNFLRSFFRYKDIDDIKKHLVARVIMPAETKLKEDEEVRQSFLDLTREDYQDSNCSWTAP